MKRLNLIARLTSLVLLVCLCLPFVPASAASTGSVTVNFPVENAEFKVYHAGKIENGVIVYDNIFKRVVTADMDMSKPEVVAEAASAMADIVRINTGMKPWATGKIQNGKVTFPDLPMAVYLIVGDEYLMDGQNYYPVPYLVSVPHEENGQLVYDSVISGKVEVSVDISVVKKWVGDSILNRPTSITVQLMCDGKPSGNPVRLNYVNKWSYMWEGLEPDHQWYVKETASPRYTCSITREGNTFIITNTWKKIPQTGQLWWPVTALTLGGIAFICLGLLRRKKRDEDA